jgi:hypothetical protein
LATNAREVRRRLKTLRLILDQWDARLAAAENDPLIGRVDLEKRLAAARAVLTESE